MVDVGVPKSLILLDLIFDKVEKKLQKCIIVRYNMYAMVCHSGVLGGGHYVSYSKTSSGNWFCHNDSSCKEYLPTIILH